MSTPSTPGAVSCLAVAGVGEVLAGDDLAAILARAAADRGSGVEGGLRDGDVLVVTSKVVSKAEGRRVPGDRDAALAGETARVLARRGTTAVVRTHHGLVMAGAGIDASNTEPGGVLLLPRDPDGSARRLRERLAELTGLNLAVLVTDTAGRAWRHGQTDLAIGVAGLTPVHDLAGSSDGYGNPLAVTAPAVADEIAAAADLVKGKLARRPAAVVRGLAAWVLPVGDHGPGAGVLVREEEQDMFGLGAREAVLAAVAGDPDQRAGFGRAADAADVAATLAALGGVAEARPDRVEVTLPELEARASGRLEARLEAAGFALGWQRTSTRPEAGPASRSHDPTTVLRFEPFTP